VKNTKLLQWALAAAPLILLGILTIVFASKSLHRNPQVATQALVGKPVPAVTLASLDGGPGASVAAVQGGSGPYLVNFYASWCAPCILENPTLLDLKAKGVRIVGVNYKDTPQAGRAFLTKYGDPFVAHLSDQDGRAGIEFGVSGVPETFLIGSSGVVLAKASLPLNAADAARMMALAK
jgi:cytochrome c biogenesis protein CcmG/thiol:disulfide interchange protein DsbE